MRSVNHIRLDHQIVIEKLGRECVIGKNSADFRCGEEDRIWPFASQPFYRLFLKSQIDDCPVRNDHATIFARETTKDRGSNHSMMTSNPNRFPGNRKYLLRHS